VVAGPVEDLSSQLRAAARSGDMPLGRAFDALKVADELDRLNAVIDDLVQRTAPGQFV
jgi:hypothetical protein